MNIGKISTVLGMALVASVLLWIFLFFFLTLVCGVEWAFTSIEYNRFMTWLEDDWKHPSQMYYLCYLVSFIFVLSSPSEEEEKDGD